MREQTRIRNVLAPANNSLRRRQAAEFRTQPERPFQQLRKAPRTLALAEQLPCFRRAASGSETGDLPLDDRQFDASDTCRFPSAEDLGDTRFLKVTDSHAASLDPATQQERQLDVRNQMKPTSKVVAGDGFRFPAYRNG
jgi:hypothetical protein